MTTAREITTRSPSSAVTSGRASRQPDVAVNLAEDQVGDLVEAISAAP